jgi:predicted MPP superfamily phosphohydrolase
MFLLFLLFLFLCSVGTGFLAGRRSAAAFFPRSRLARALWTALATAAGMVFFAGFFLRGPERATAMVAGAAWIITLPYWMPALALHEGVRFVQRRRPFLPSALVRRPLAVKRFFWLGTAAVVAALLGCGYLRFDNPVVVEAAVVLNKPVAGRESLRIAIASDLHLGDVIGRERLAGFVDKINATGADIVLLAGDLVDFRAAVLVEQNMGAELSRLRAPLGVYAVLGNHDVFDVSRGAVCSAYFEASGIRVLRDEVVRIGGAGGAGAMKGGAGGAFYLVGRRDHAEGEMRRPLAELLRGAGVDVRKQPVLVLDHQPRNAHVREAARLGADLQVSGHTHGGQVWPITWVVPQLFKHYYGLGREDGMAVYVTSGLGLWGFPARIGSQSEIVVLTAKFGGAAK